MSAFCRQTLKEIQIKICTATLWRNDDKYSAEAQSVECKMEEIGGARGSILISRVSENIYFLALLYELLTYSVPVLAAELSPFKRWLDSFLTPCSSWPQHSDPGHR